MRIDIIKQEHAINFVDENGRVDYSQSYENTQKSIIFGYVFNRMLERVKYENIALSSEGYYSITADMLPFDLGGAETPFDVGSISRMNTMFSEAMNQGCTEIRLYV